MLRYIALLAAFTLLQGCGITMTRYEPDYDNLAKLRAQMPLQTMAEPQADAAPGEDSVLVRNNPIRSPSGSLSGHLQQALNSELQAAGLLQSDATQRLHAHIRSTDLNSALFGQGRGHLQVDFELRRGQAVAYSSSKRVEHVWDSNFIGAIAIPRAANAYNTLVRKLLAELYADPAFIAALKP